MKNALRVTCVHYMKPSSMKKLLCLGSVYMWHILLKRITSLKFTPEFSMHL